MKYRSPAQEAVCRSNLDPKRRHLLRTALDYATADGQGMYVGITALAHDTGESQQMVKRLRRDFFRRGILRHTGPTVTERGTTVQTYGLDLAALAEIPPSTAQQRRIEAAHERESRPDIRERRLDQGAKLRKQALQRKGVQELDFSVREGTTVPCDRGTTVPSQGVQPCPPPGYNRAVAGGTVVPPSILDRSKELIEERSCAADASLPAHRNHRALAKMQRQQQKGQRSGGVRYG